jgi:ABC-type antimicrobial peptide transport system permease subunit
MENVVAESTSAARFDTWLMAVFSGTALLLAVIGIYGLMAYIVEQRRLEIGIRMALGAQPGRIRNSFLGRGLLVSLIGLVVGLTAAYNVSKLMARFLFGVTPRDPITFMAIPLLLILVALAAAWLPARVASRSNPSTLLRQN